MCQMVSSVHTQPNEPEFEAGGMGLRILVLAYLVIIVNTTENSIVLFLECIGELRPVSLNKKNTV